MIRITVVNLPDSKIRVIVEGRITKGSSVELAGACLEHLAAGEHLVLDLSGVNFADSDGVHLVRDLLKRGCVLGECSELVRTLVGNQSSHSPKSNGAGNENELQMLAQLRAGDDAAFEMVVQRYGGRMLATARRFLNNEHDAQDAVQEAFASAFRALDKFNGDAMLSTWLHRIVVNASLVQLRSRRRRSEQPIEPLLPRFDHDGEWIDDPATRTDATETILERRDSREMVRRCIERLPDKYRCVLLLRDIEELDTEETARSLATTANTVKVRLHRARQALKTLIERDSALQAYDSSHTRSSLRNCSTSIQADGEELEFI
jgi:RNA polymerase sigma-70 factor (ECF subfamily)